MQATDRALRPFTAAERREYYTCLTPDPEIARLGWGDVILDGSDVMVFEGGLSATGTAWRGEFRSVANARFAAEAIIAIDSPGGALAAAGADGVAPGPPGSTRLGLGPGCCSWGRARTRLPPPRYAGPMRTPGEHPKVPFTTQFVIGFVAAILGFTVGAWVIGGRLPWSFGW